MSQTLQFQFECVTFRCTSCLGFQYSIVNYDTYRLNETTQTIPIRQLSQSGEWLSEIPIVSIPLSEIVWTALAHKMLMLQQTLNSCRCSKRNKRYRFVSGISFRMDSPWLPMRIRLMHATNVLICCQFEAQQRRQMKNTTVTKMSEWRKRLPHYIELLEHSVCTKYSKRLVMFQFAWSFSTTVEERNSQQKRVIAGARGIPKLHGFIYRCASIKMLNRQKSNTKNQRIKKRSEKKSIE